MANGDLHTLFTFGKTIGNTIVEISNTDTDVVIHIRENDEHEDEGGYLFLDPQEIDLFIATLNLYKHKILNPRMDVDK